MKAIKKNEHFTAEIELSEAEIQSLLSLFEEICMYRQMLPEDAHMGLRGELYRQFKELLTSNTNK